jgi:hypothetical protein
MLKSEAAKGCVFLFVVLIPKRIYFHIRIEAVVGSSAKKVEYRMIGIKERLSKRKTGIEKLYAFDDDGYLLLPRNDYMDLDFIITANNL